jgi:hypothetical protein
MSLWRVRIAMSADPRSQELLMAALANQRVWALLPPTEGVSENVSENSDGTGEVIIELPRDESLGTILSDLHQISPQVFVSSVTEPYPLLPHPPPISHRSVIRIWRD